MGTIDPSSPKMYETSLDNNLSRSLKVSKDSTGH